MSGSGKNGFPHKKRVLIFKQNHKHNLKWMIDLNIQANTVKLLEESKIKSV